MVTSTSPLTVTNVSKSFKGSAGETIHAVQDISFTIGRGEVVAFLGPNGAGKSTTIDMALGLTRPDSGRIQVFGTDPLKAARSGRCTAMTQTGGLLPDMTIRQTMEIISSLYRGSDMNTCMERARLTHLANRQVSKCSGGERQRLRFALALLPDPDFLILDEPTAGMDVEARRDFWDEIHEDTRRGRTILFATHYLGEVDEFADRVILIKEGRIIADDTSDAIRTLSGGCTVTATIPNFSLTQLDLPGTQLIKQDGSRINLHHPDSDALASKVMQLGGTDLRVVPRSLDDAFLALTSKES
ncbi:ABC transporter ATP-binding protein [Cutibacterium sp. WCA-380-WT-3A]|uniref:ABC transporter ATP-binding protein n=1 Tax=Cutibacterium porci TaxID=2605781 RepID=A0A7K0J3V9_9ACTN|nr:ABC transporter ATP-binding protein [Cutibacterium porci]MSS44604.1 ABC transporter ATP-binding protein [Cutibacterium porci]